MRSFPALLVVFLLIHTWCNAQQRTMDNVWPLQRCVQYAIEHNITIKQDSLNARLARHALTQSQLSQIPALNVSGSYGRSFGRSINPTTNQFVESAYNFLGPSASSNVLLFGWMQVRNTIERNRYSLEASLADLDQRMDDIALNVANSYLIALLAKEQINISTNQVGLSKAQLDQTKAFADAGRLPELNVAQLESQLASDSSNLINSIANYNAAILDLKALLNLDFAEPFTIQAPEVSPGDQMMVAQTPPAEVYQVARTHFGSIKGSHLRVNAAEKALAAAKGNLYPQLSLSYQVGTNYASNYFSYQQTSELLGLVPIGMAYPSGDTVYRPEYKTLTPTVPFNNQLRNNIRQSVVLNLNIPLFNSWQSQYAVRQARINLAQQELSEYNTELTLKQNVYKAHNNAVNSIQKYNAAVRAQNAAKRALDFAQKRYELGLTSTVDLLVTQNTEFAASANLISAKYDLIFKLKVIDYYLGRELKL
jgi:outer membrane protein